MSAGETHQKMTGLQEEVLRDVERTQTQMHAACMDALCKAESPGSSEHPSNSALPRERAGQPTQGPPHALPTLAAAPPSLMGELGSVFRVDEFPGYHPRDARGPYQKHRDTNQLHLPRAGLPPAPGPQELSPLLIRKLEPHTRRGPSSRHPPSHSHPPTINS